MQPKVSMWSLMCVWCQIELRYAVFMFLQLVCVLGVDRGLTLVPPRVTQSDKQTRKQQQAFFIGCHSYVKVSTHSRSAERRVGKEC